MAHHGPNPANQQFNQAHQRAVQQNMDRAHRSFQQNAARFQENANRANQAFYDQQRRFMQNTPAGGQGSGSVGGPVLIIAVATIVGLTVLVGIGILAWFLVVRFMH